MQVIRKNFKPLEVELKKKNSENFELKSLVRSLRNKAKAWESEITSFFEQTKELEKEKEATARTLDTTLANLNQTKVELE